MREKKEKHDKPREQYFHGIKTYRAETFEGNAVAGEQPPYLSLSLSISIFSLILFLLFSLALSPSISLSARYFSFDVTLLVATQIVGPLRQGNGYLP